MPALNGLVLSDFNSDNLTALLGKLPGQPELTIRPTPYGQVMQLLADPLASCWNPAPDFVVVWTRPEAVIPSFGSVLAYRPVPRDTLEQEVRQFATLLTGLASRTRFVLAPSWVLPPGERGYGLLEMRSGLGFAHTLQWLNLRLVEALEPAPSAYVLDASRWVQAAGSQGFVPKLWYMGKIPFGLEVFKAAAREIQAALAALTGAARKLLVLDLDERARHRRGAHRRPGRRRRPGGLGAFDGSGSRGPAGQPDDGAAPGGFPCLT